MIAPEPALAGPRPAAKPRETARSEPEKARGEDFESVLKEPSGKAEAAPVVVPDAAPEGADADVAGMLVVPPIVVPAAVAPVPVEDGIAVEATPAFPVARAPWAGDAALQAAALVVGEVQAAPDEAVAPPVAAPVVQEAAVTVAPAAKVVPARAGGEAALPVEGREAAAEVPADAAPRREDAGAARAPAAPSTPAGHAAPVEAGAPVTLREAAAPVWHLAADPGQGLARAEAVAAPHVAHAAAAAAPVQAQAVVGQLAVAVGRASDDTVEIRLDPPELGRVQIHLTRSDGGVQAVVLADRPETQDLLRRHAGELARELGQAGYDSVSLDFGGGAAHAGREGAAMDWFEEAPAVPASAAAAPAPIAAPRRSIAGGLDVRL